MGTSEKQTAQPFSQQALAQEMLHLVNCMNRGLAEIEASKQIGGQARMDAQDRNAFWVVLDQMGFRKFTAWSQFRPWLATLASMAEKVAACTAEELNAASRFEERGAAQQEAAQAFLDVTSRARGWL